jgi:hypothetical protein
MDASAPHVHVKHHEHIAVKKNLFEVSIHRHDRLLSISAYA